MENCTVVKENLNESYDLGNVFSGTLAHVYTWPLQR